NALGKIYREKWSEALSFFLGKRLIGIGYSAINILKHKNSQLAVSAYSPDFETEINNPGRPPIKIDDSHLLVNEVELSKLLERYLDNSEIFALTEVMWKIW